MKNNGKIIRTFLALNLPQKNKDMIYDLYSSIRNEFKINIKWVIPENLHLTVKFLGSVKEETLDEIIKRLENLKLKLNISLNIHSYGVFPPNGIPKVFWVSLKEKSGNDDTGALFKTIEQECKKLGFPEEKRKFTPHITIARLKLNNAAELNRFNQLLEIFKTNFNKIDKEFFIINKLTLFKSELTPSGPVYSIIREF